MQEKNCYKIKWIEKCITIHCQSLYVCIYEGIQWY